MSTLVPLDNKAIGILKGKSTKISNRVAGMKIESQEALQAATDVLKEIKESSKALKEMREDITRPMNESLRKVREMFAPIENDLLQAESTIKREMLSWNRQVEEAARETAAELERAVDSGEMKVSVAAAQLQNIPQAQSKVSGKKGSIQYRTVRKVRITDVSKIPTSFLEYPKVMEALLTAVRPFALQGGVIAGVEVYEEKEIAGGL